VPKGCTALSRQVVTSARCAISGYPAPHSLPPDTLHALPVVLACMSGAQRAPGPRSRVEEHILLACGNEQRRALNERRHGFNAAWMSAFLADRVIRKQPSAGLRLCGSLQLTPNRDGCAGYRSERLPGPVCRGALRTGGLQGGQAGNCAPPPLPSPAHIAVPMCSDSESVQVGGTYGTGVKPEFEGDVHMFQVPVLDCRGP